MSAEIRAVYVISVAAELAGVHPQTLRIYERKGLLEPSRTRGGNRRYSPADIRRLQRIAELTEAGVGLAGVKRILELEAQVEQLNELVTSLTHELARVRAQAPGRDLVPMRQAVSRFGEVPPILRRP